MKKIERILCLVLMLMLCVAPIRAFAQSEGDQSKKPKLPYEITGEIFKVVNEEENYCSWYIRDCDGDEYRISPALPGMEKAFLEYEGLQVSVRGNRCRCINSSLEVNSISYNRYLCTVEAVVAGRLEYKFIEKENKMMYVLLVQDHEMNELGWILDNDNSILSQDLVGKNIVIGGSTIPFPFFKVGEIFE